MFRVNKRNIEFHDETVTIPIADYFELSGGKYGNNGLTNELDDYMMYTFKVKPCSIHHPHIWTDCPFAHQNEKAARRDPRTFSYVGVSCPDWQRNECCSQGQKCGLAHGLFEFWLHPSRYRTRPCDHGMNCARKVCFFAHTRGQLREELPEMITPSPVPNEGGNDFSLFARSPVDMFLERLRRKQVQNEGRRGQSCAAALPTVGSGKRGGGGEYTGES